MEILFNPTIRLTHADVSMLVTIYQHQINRPTCSPKAYMVGGRRKGRWGKATPESIRAFDRLIAFGLVEHSPNGHCWLTDLGMRLAQGAVESSMP